MEGGWPTVGGFLLCLTVSLLLQGFLLATGRGNIFTINCSGFDQHGVDPAAFQALFDLKVFCPATNISIPTHINIFHLSAILEMVANRCRPNLFILNLLVSSSFLVTIDTLSVYLTAGNKNLASFKITLLLGYNVLLLMIKDLLPTSGTPLISKPSFPPGVYFALCLSLMVLSLLETIFISYLLHLATTQPPPMPRWLHFLLLHCTSPRTCCPAVPQKGNTGLDHLPGVKEPMEFVGKMPGPRERAKWVPSVSKDLAGKQDSEAALGQPVGAVKPHDGHPGLLSLPALQGHPITTVIIL